MRNTLEAHVGFLALGLIVGCLAGPAIVPGRTPRNPGHKPGELFAKWGVNTQDIQQAHLLMQLRTQGEFILLNENPLRRKFIDYDLREIVAKAAEDRSAEYDGVFRGLGLSPQVSIRLQRHLLKIHLASLQTEVAIEQVQDARSNYDAHLRKLLGEERYNRYRNYELRKPAIREYEEFRRKAAGLGVDPGSVSADVVIDLFQRTGAYSHRTWHGPFDGLPECALGRSNVIQLLSQEQARLSEKGGALNLFVERERLPQPLRIALSNYLSGKLQQIRDAIDRSPITGDSSTERTTSRFTH